MSVITNRLPNAGEFSADLDLSGECCLLRRQTRIGCDCGRSGADLSLGNVRLFVCLQMESFLLAQRQLKPWRVLPSIRG